MEAYRERRLKGQRDRTGAHAWAVSLRPLGASALALALMAATLSACAGVQSPPVRPVTARPAKSPSPDHPHRIWVLRMSWHTGLVLSSSDLGSRLAFLLSRVRRGRYFIFGWGDRRYYLSAHPTSGIALAALFPSRSVMLVQSCERDLVRCLGPSVHLRVLRVSPPDLAKLRRYLAHSFLKDPGHRAVPVARGPFPESMFFASGRTYDAFETCNTWTAQALEAAGLPVSADGVIFANQLWGELPGSQKR